MSQINFNKAFVVLLLLFITAVFTAMIWPFLMTIIMAAIFSGLTRPMYRGLKTRVGRPQQPGGRARAALRVLLPATAG